MNLYQLVTLIQMNLRVGDLEGDRLGLVVGPVDGDVFSSSNVVIIKHHLQSEKTVLKHLTNDIIMYQLLTDGGFVGS